MYLKTYVFVLLLSTPPPPFPRSDSPSLVDKVGLSEAHAWGAPSVEASGVEVGPGPPMLTSADFSPGHTQLGLPRAHLYSSILRGF